MLSSIWSGASTASDVLLLIAAVVAAIDAIITARVSPPGSLLPAAVCLLSLGLLAL